MSMGNLHGRPFFGVSGETFWRGFGFADLNVGKGGIGDEGEIGRRSREGMEDSAAILCQISSYKDELDLVNEEIEASIQKTREIESEIVRCSELEKKNQIIESELTKIVSLEEFKLIGLNQVTASMRKSVEVIEDETRVLKLDSDNLRKEIAQKREEFIAACMNFQSYITEGIHKEEVTTLLAENNSLEKDKFNLDIKIKTLKSFSSEFIEEILGELCNDNLG
ncbi:hypothetical protein ZOSMA_1G03570 [Zostera marina]|uniref:Uncharacterized protein n=1 Tax=Zostera marina TaxID=29655 RepID=A0A0K9PN30_ZOSMR|nr:hypothetical protein ZOSMA_1G03570 [Zostera marina]